MPFRIVAGLALAACTTNPVPAPNPQVPVKPVVAPTDPTPRVSTLPSRGVISARNRHACARTSDGHVACWGQLAPPRTIMVGSYFAPEMNPSVPKIVPGLDHVVGVAAGDSVRCAWTERGEVWCWGWLDTSTERAPARIANLTDVVEVAGGDLDHMFCVRTRRGTVSCWSGLASTVTPVAHLDDAVEIAVAYEHACARRASGEVVCWVGTAPDKLVPIAAARDAISLAGVYTGNGTFAALLPGGRTLRFERPLGNVVAGPTVPDARSIAIGGETCVLGKTLACWTADKPAPVTVPVTDATHVATGGEVSCARLATGRIRCWGAAGFRGDGSTSLALEATDVAGLTGVQQLAISDSTTCARLATGRVACWGHRFQDAKGAGDVALADPTPVELPDITNAIDIRLDASTGCARLADKRTACWGWDRSPSGRMLRKPTVIPKLANIGPLFEGPCGMRGNQLVCLAPDSRIDNPTRWAQLAGKQRFWRGGFARNSWTCVRATSGMNCLYVHNGRGYTDVYPEQGFEVIDAIDLVGLYGMGGMCMVRANGSVGCKGGGSDDVTVTDDALSISRGPSNGSCALIKDGTVRCWDHLTHKTIVTPKLDDAVEIAGGGYHACARRKNGTVACWGEWDKLGNAVATIDAGDVKGSF